MNNNAIIDKAVRLAVARLDRENIQPGCTLAHPDHRYAFLCERVADGVVYGDDARGKVSFPLSEVFDPSECQSIAFDIQREMTIWARRAAARN